MSSASAAEHHRPKLTPIPDSRRAHFSLPVPLTPLLGRDEDVAAIQQMLDADDVPFVSLLGPGGIGKTRLAIEVATQMEPDFAHGAVFVSLASIRDADHVVPAIAGALGLREDSSRSIAAAVLATLLDRHLLLVLDNLEHLIDGVVGWVDEVVTTCPRLSLLVTSRVALGVAGEHRFQVPPLPLPDRAAMSAVESIAGNAAVSLFFQRARAVRHDFALTEANVKTVAEICLRLDGVPLAIELAAARTNVLTPATLLDRLTHQLDVLTGGGRHLPSRHQTMSSAIAWSYDLLSESEQLLFRRLSVFLSGFSLDAAEAVLGSGDSEPDVPALDLVALLVDHSLVRQVAGADDESRFMVLEPIREFGLVRQAAHNEESMARDAHAAWYLRLGERAERGLQGGEQVWWLDLLEAEHDNLRSAFTWLFDRDRVEDAADLAYNLGFFRLHRGHNRAFRTYLDALLNHPLMDGPTLARAKVLVASGVAHISVSAFETSLPQLREALSIFRDHGANAHTATSLHCIGIALMSRDTLAEATIAFEECVTLGREVHHPRRVSAALGNLGIIATIQGRLDDAMTLQEEALQIARDAEDTTLIAEGMLGLGDIAFKRGDDGQAESLFREGMDMIATIGDKSDIPWACLSLAKIAINRGDYATANAFLEDALTVARDIGDGEMMALAQMALGELASLEERYNDAMEMLRRGIATLSVQGRLTDAVDCLDAFAGLAERTGDMVSSARLLGAADAALGRAGIPRTQGTSQEDHRHRSSAVRSALGESAFSVAYGEGGAMSLEQAVALATALEPAGETRASPIHADASGLSPREMEVLRLIADGHSNQEIADRLFISRRTVASHAATILGKIGLTSRTGVVAYAIRNGLA